jgi:PAS domain S-box-containing protein
MSIQEIETLTEKLITTDLQMKATLAEFNAFLRATPDAVVTLGNDGSIMRWNDSASKLFGYSQHEAIGQSATIIMPEEFRKQHHEALQRVINTGVLNVNDVVSRTAVTKSGDKIKVQLSLAIYGAHGKRFVTAIIRES